MTGQVQNSGKETDKRSENFEFPNLAFCDNRPADKKLSVFHWFEIFSHFHLFIYVNNEIEEPCEKFQV